jgi:ABC-type glycerol-3-phosphate transport system substrate-binding protein
MKMKKVLLIGLIAAMGLGLAACGKHHSNKDKNNSANGSTNTQTKTTPKLQHCNIPVSIEGKTEYICH